MPTLHHICFHAMLYALCPMLLLLERQLRNNVRKILTRNAEIGYLFEILTGGIKGNGKSYHLEHIDIAEAILNGDHFFWFNMKPLEDPFHPLCLLIIADLDLHLSSQNSIFLEKIIRNRIVKAILLMDPIGKNGKARGNDRKFQSFLFKMGDQFISPRMKGNVFNDFQ